MENDLDPLAGSVVEHFSSPDVMSESRHVHTFSGDKELRNYAGLAGDTYEKAAREQAPQFDSTESRKAVEQKVFEGARAARIQQIHDQIPERGAAPYVAERLPFFGSAATIGNAMHLRDASQRFQAGQADAGDYHTMAQAAKEQQQLAGRSWGRKTLDMASALPGMAAEWAMTGGLAAGAGEAAAGAAARIGAPKAIGIGANLLTQGAVRTASNPLALGAAVTERMQPQVGVNDQGVQIQQGSSLPKAALQGVASKVIENATFSGSGFLGSQPGRSYAMKVINALGTIETNEDLQHLAALAPRGGPVWRLAFGDSEGRIAALQDLASNAAGLGLFELGMHAHDQIRRTGERPDTDKLAQAGAKTILEQEVEKENAQQNAPGGAGTQQQAPVAENPLPPGQTPPAQTGTQIQGERADVFDQLPKTTPSGAAPDTGTEGVPAAETSRTQVFPQTPSGGESGPPPGGEDRGQLPSDEESQGQEHKPIDVEPSRKTGGVLGVEGGSVPAIPGATAGSPSGDAGRSEPAASEADAGSQPGLLDEAMKQPPLPMPESQRPVAPERSRSNDFLDDVFTPSWSTEKQQELERLQAGLGNIKRKKDAQAAERRINKLLEDKQAATNQQPAQAPQLSGGLANLKPRLSVGAAMPTPEPAPPPPGTPGVQSGEQSPPGPQKPVSEKPWHQRAADYLKELGGQIFPRTTRMSEATGEALGRFVASPEFIKAAKSHYSSILGIDKMSEADRRLIGATFMEERFRHARAYFQASGQDEKAAAVGTLVGQPGSPLPDEKSFNLMQQSGAYWGFKEAWRQEFVPEMRRSYTGAKGLDPFDEIESPTQMPGYPINAKAMKAGQKGGAAIGGRGNLDNTRIRKMGFTNEASLAAPAYDIDIGNIVANSLERGVGPARQAEAYRTAVKEGVGEWGTPREHTEGFVRLPGSKPPAGTQEAQAGQEFYVHPDAAGEWRKALATDVPAGRMFSALSATTGFLNKVSLTSLAELSSHLANNLTAQFRPGMRPNELYSEGVNVIRNDPEVKRRIQELARIGAMHEQQPAGGLLGERLKNYDPTYWLNRGTSAMIDTLGKVTRLQLDNAYTRLIQSKEAPDIVTGRRDFINQAVGQYNNRATNAIVQFFKDSGIGPFATAGTTFTIQGIKQAYGGATNIKNASMQLRIRNLAKILPFLATPLISNYLIWGSIWGDDDTPMFAFKTGEQAGKTSFFDPLAFVGVRRGWRATGASAVMEGVRSGKTGGQMFDKATTDMQRTVEHPFMGPPGRFLQMAYSGKDALGRQAAPVVSQAKTEKGIQAAQDAGKPVPGSSQRWENIKTAAANANPVISTFGQFDKPSVPRTFAENVQQSIGPFGIHERDTSGLTKIQRQAMAETREQHPDRAVAKLVDAAVNGDQKARGLLDKSNIDSDQRHQLWTKLRTEQAYEHRGLTAKAAQARVWGTPGDPGELRVKKKKDLSALTQ